MNRCIKLALASVLFLNLITITATKEYDYCDQVCEDGAVNSLCNNDCENAVCNAYDIDDDFRQYLLDLHNEHRNKLALGNVKEAHKASNMRAMEYDEELELSLKCSIVKIGFKHDGCRGSESYFPQGQNLQKSNTNGSTWPTVRLVSQLGVEGWFDEITLVKDPGIYDKFVFDHDTGHYTQLVWAKSYLIGCHACNYLDGKFKNVVVGCNYYEAGNMVGDPIYKKGEPASECGLLKPNPVYKGLCGTSRPVKMTKHHDHSQGANRAHHRRHDMILVKITAMMTVLMPQVFSLNHYL